MNENLKKKKNKKQEKRWRRHQTDFNLIFQHMGD